mmetsp:Transcript_15856/g.66841  ORF Transcript_15856/g.66841 Transcript_15856/m.66841 type:complete len:413 (+) Transcript_15856:1873-3111(+)
MFKTWYVAFSLRTFASHASYLCPMFDRTPFLCLVEASKVLCSSSKRAVTSEFIWCCLWKSSGNGYRLAPKASQIFKIFARARSPAKKTTTTVFSTFSPLRGSSVLPSITLCFKNMFPLVTRNSTRSNEGVLCVRTVAAMNPSLTALGSCAPTCGVSYSENDLEVDLECAPPSRTNASSESPNRRSPISVSVGRPTAPPSKPTPPEMVMSERRDDDGMDAPASTAEASARASSKNPPAFSSTSCSSTSSECDLRSFSVLAVIWRSSCSSSSSLASSSSRWYGRSSASARGTATRPALCICSAKKRILRSISSQRFTWLAYVRWNADRSGFRSRNCTRPTSPSAVTVSCAASAGTIICTSCIVSERKSSIVSLSWEGRTGHEPPKSPPRTPRARLSARSRDLACLHVVLFSSFT